MRISLTLVLLLLFAAAVPTAWGQDDPGDDDMPAADESEVVADAPGDEEEESDQGADGDELVEPEAEDALADEPPESAEADASSADEESFANDEDTSADMPDAGDNGEDLSEPEGDDASADDADDSDAASEAESAADAAGAMASGEEEEEAEDSADGEDALDTEDAAEIADAEGQETDSAKVEGAGGNGANANQPGPAPAATQAPAAPAPAAKPTESKAPGGSSPAWPTANFRFMVDLGLGTGEVPFQEVSGLDVEAQIIKYRAGNSGVPIKMPGLVKGGNITLKKGIFAKDNKFFEWQRSIKLNTIKQRSTVTIRLLDESGSPVMTWTLANAYLVHFPVMDVKSDSNEVAVDSIEIAHEGLTATQ